MRPAIAVNNRLVEIERDIQDSHGLITPEQEAEIEAIIQADVAQAGRAIVSFDERRKRLDALRKEAKLRCEFWEKRANAYRAAMSGLMAKHANGDGKYSLRDEAFNAHIRTREGEVEVFDPDNVPRIYLKVVTEEKPDIELLRVGIEAKEPGAMACARIVGKGDKYVVIKANKDALLQQEIRAALE